MPASIYFFGFAREGFDISLQSVHQKGVILAWNIHKGREQEDCFSLRERERELERERKMEAKIDVNRTGSKARRRILEL